MKKITITCPVNTLSAVLEVAENFGAVTVIADAPGWHSVLCSVDESDVSGLETFKDWANQFVALSPTIQKPNCPYVYPFAEITNA